MRILFFSNIAITPETLTGKSGGGWIAALLSEMEDSSNKIAVGHFGFKESKECFGNITVYNMTVYKGNWFKRCIYHALRMTLISPLLTFNDTQHESQSWSFFEKKMLDVINDFNPDIIHVFGSESYYGLVASLTTAPVVLHIQGFLNPCKNAYLPPFISWMPHNCILHPHKWLKNIVTRRTLIKDSFREREILSRVKFFIGRTEWDRRVLYCFNPKAKYFYGGEILRGIFYQPSERIIPDSLVIISIISKPSYKGIDMILKTAYVLKNYLQLEFSWKVFGAPNMDVISMTSIKPKSVNVETCGRVSSDILHKELLNSTCFFHPSYIDNSPNSLCEAQILGVTSIACNVGGISSLIEDGQTGFLVPANDPYQAAYLISKIFKDKHLNETIGLNSQIEASKRHSKENILNQISVIYNAVLASNKKEV